MRALANAAECASSSTWTLSFDRKCANSPLFDMPTRSASTPSVTPFRPDWLISARPRARMRSRVDGAGLAMARIKHDRSFDVKHDRSFCPALADPARERALLRIRAASRDGVAARAPGPRWRRYA